MKAMDGTILAISYEINPALVSVVLGTALLGLATGALGSLAVLRRNSLLGDALSHAAYPGLLAGFLLSGTKSVGLMVLGAILAAAMALYLTNLLGKGGRVRPDAALALVMGCFFGIAMVLQSHLQQNPSAAQAGLKDYLFGQAGLLLEEDIPLLVCLALLVLFVLGWGWSRWKIITFDRSHALSLGIHVPFWDMLYSFLLILSVVIGLQVAGVVLMSALLVMPGCASRYWTTRMSSLVTLSGITGAFLGIGGTFTADELSWPPGPTIVLLGFIWLFISYGAFEIRRKKRALRQPFSPGNPFTPPPFPIPGKAPSNG